MRRVGQLWERIVGFDNLLLAYRKARRGKGDRREVAEFALNLEKNLLELQDQLIADEYGPGVYRLFTIYERKPRLIAAAPFRDRVVHHALMNLVEPPLDGTFIFDSYACRKEKGVHVAVDRYQAWAQQYGYALKLDIEKYFSSIDRSILKGKLRRCLKDEKVLALFERIIDTAPAQDAPLVWYPGDDLFTPVERRRGIPIGNLTSQFLANLYLNDLDHFIKEKLTVKAYLRYVDDMVILGNSKTDLYEVKRAIESQLSQDRLRLHPNKAHVSPTRAGLNVLGYIVFPDHRRLRADNGHRFERRLRRLAQAYRAGKLDWDDVNPRVRSWIGHAMHADTQGLRRAIFRRTVFSRGTGQ